MRHSIQAAITAAVLLSIRPATSAPEPPEPAAQKELREQANRLVRAGRLADARDIHLSLWRVNHRPNNAFNIGMLSYRIHDFPTAAEYLTLWLDLVGPPDAPKVPADKGHKERYENARIDLGEARKHVGTIEVHVSDPGAEVLVDDRRIGVSPLRFPVFVDPGRHGLVAQLGGARVEEAVAIEAGGEKTARLVLPAAVTATPARPTPVKASPARPSPPEPTKWPRWQTVAVVAAPVVLAAGGVATLVAANGAADDRDAAAQRARSESRGDCPDGGPACAEFTAADGRAKTMTALSVGAFVGAGVAAAGATVYLMLTPTTPVRLKTAGTTLQIAGSW